MSGCWFRFVFISSKLCRLISGMCVYNNMNNVSCWNVIVWCVLAMWDVYRMSYDVSCMVYMEVYVGGGGGGWELYGGSPAIMCSPWLWEFSLFV